MGATRVVVERFDVRTADGALLATDVYRLDDTVRRPCLLQRVPYGRTVPTIVNGALDVRRAVDAGFAVVVQDCRGRGGSTGDFVPFDHERDDAVATFDWICEQPWSNGAVGMFGRSYAALNQWLAAESGHPALKAIAPVISGDDPSEWIHPAGVLESGFVLWWSLRYLAPELASRSDDPSSQAALAELVSEPSRLLRIRHVSDLAGVMEHVPFLARWLSEAEPQPRATRREANVPALVIAGWFDIFARSTLDTFKRRSSESGEDRLIIGPWAHGGAFSGVYPDWDAGPHGSDAAIDLTGLQLDWFRHHLGGGSPLSTERVRAFLCGSNRWLSLSSWPPTESSHLALAVVERADSLELGPAPEPPRTGPVVEVPLDVRDPFPTRGGPTFLPGMEVAANAGPRAQGSLLERADVVVAQSAVLPQELCVMGDVILHARAIVEATAGQQSPALLCARLCDRMPDGTTLVVTEGAASVPAESGEHHVDLCLGPVGWSFAPQHRLVLTLSRASVPRFRPPAHDEPERIVIDTGGATVLRLPLVASSTTSGGEGGP